MKNKKSLKAIAEPSTAPPDSRSVSDVWRRTLTTRMCSKGARRRRTRSARACTESASRWNQFPSLERFGSISPEVNPLVSPSVPSWLSWLTPGNSRAPNSPLSWSSCLGLRQAPGGRSDEANVGAGFENSPYETSLDTHEPHGLSPDSQLPGRAAATLGLLVSALVVSGFAFGAGAKHTRPWCGGRCRRCCRRRSGRLGLPWKKTYRRTNIMADRTLGHTALAQCRPGGGWPESASTRWRRALLGIGWDLVRLRFGFAQRVGAAGRDQAVGNDGRCRPAVGSARKCRCRKGC